MEHMRQFTPNQVSLLAALGVTLIAGSFLFVAVWSCGQLLGVWQAIALAALLFMVAYPVFRFALERFVHGRIKMLYRTVHDLRRGRSDASPALIKSNVLERANEDVNEWANERRNEIGELQEREKFRREFIGNLAHELKTPIFNIQGYILTLLEGGLEDEKVNRDFLNRASNGVDRLMKIVEDLDLITKLESGVMELRTVEMDLGVALKEAIESLEMHARQKGMSLRNAVPAGTMVQADRNRIAQVFMNLLNNAINYGREGGTCTVSSYALGNQLVVEVSDDGIGISAEHLPRLFERFYRVGKSRARNEGGSGLGLAIVKHIIEAHGQTIAVKSEEGKGTTFVFTLLQVE
jgi:two-component system, OmpR family, phosphate regulon sensor histidine kinase PhoR